MALYHFTVKNDKHPGTKKQIKAALHTDYINREGKYKNEDERQPQHMDNVISSAQKSNAVGEKTLLLYSSSYGKIINTEKGLALTEDPSYDTIAVALMIAKRTMKEPLTVNGSTVFRAKCIHAALLADLPVTFEDPAMQSILDKKRKEKNDEQERFRKQGGRVIIRKNIPKPDPDEDQRADAKTPSIRTIPTMRQLPKRHVVRTRPEDAALSLSGTPDDQLGHLGAERTPPVRWDLSYGRRRYAERTARRILESFERHKDTIGAQHHVEYINREKAFFERGDCVHKQHRLPAWAKDSPTVFFRAADRYSPKNAARYKEIEFALQNELTLEQNIEIVNRFIEANLPDHYYTLAIHDKIGAMSDGSHNLHVHIVFSTVLHLRASYEEITNSVLEKYGHRARIDHRSLKAQEQEARMNGDVLLANLLHRIPEEHVGNGVLREAIPEIQRIKKYRTLKKEYRDLLFAAERTAHSIEEDAQNEKNEHLKKSIQTIITSHEFTESEHDSASHISKLRSNFIEAVHAYEHLERMLIPTDNAHESAKIEYMTPEEKEIYKAYKKTLADIRHWTEFKENLSEPKNGTPKELAAYRQLLPALDDKIVNLTYEQHLLQDKIDAIEIRLKNTDIQKQIQLITHDMLLANTQIRKNLAKAAQNINITMRALAQGLFAKAHMENRQDIYTTRQLYTIVRKRFYGYKKEMERLQSQLETAKKKVLSMDRALQMGANVYTKGGLKKLREAHRTWKKKEGYLQNDRVKLEQEVAAFQKLPIPSFDDRDAYTEYQARKRALDERHDALTKKAQELADQKTKLDAWQKRLAAQIDSPQGKEKIKEVALGIMRKNEPYQKQYDALKGQLARAAEKMNRAKVQMEALAEAVKKDQNDTGRYKITAAEKGKDRPSIIAEAVAGNAYYASLVATMQNDNSALKTWTLMSEAAKEEETNKKMYRDL